MNGEIVEEKLKKPIIKELYMNFIKAFCLVSGVIISLSILDKNVNLKLLLSAIASGVLIGIIYAIYRLIARISGKKNEL